MLLDTIELPDDLEWEVEISWNPVVQTVERGATGALFIQESVKIKGREITLVGGSDMCWISRTTVEALRTKRDAVGSVMTLTIGITNYTVMFRQGETPVDVKAVRRAETDNPNSWYMINAIRLMEVE